MCVCERKREGSRERERDNQRHCSPEYSPPDGLAKSWPSLCFNRAYVEKPLLRRGPIGAKLVQILTRRARIRLRWGVLCGDIPKERHGRPTCDRRGVVAPARGRPQQRPNTTTSAAHAAHLGKKHELPALEQRQPRAMFTWATGTRCPVALGKSREPLPASGGEYSTACMSTTHPRSVAVTRAGVGFSNPRAALQDPGSASARDKFKAVRVFEG